jgi:hypothetical protein
MLFGSQKSRKKLMDTKSSMSNRMKFKQERERERERTEQNKEIVQVQIITLYYQYKNKKIKEVNFSLETPPTHFPKNRKIK